MRNLKYWVVLIVRTKIFENFIAETMIAGGVLYIAIWSLHFYVNARSFMPTQPLVLLPHSPAAFDNAILMKLFNHASNIKSAAGMVIGMFWNAVAALQGGKNSLLFQGLDHDRGCLSKGWGMDMLLHDRVQIRKICWPHFQAFWFKFLWFSQKPVLSKSQELEDSSKCCSI